MDVRRVDPRDQTWEVGNPVYRVYFHGQYGSSDEYEIEGASGIAEVLAWAESTPRRRSFVVYVCVQQDGLGLVRLHGEDPNEAGSSPSRLGRS